MSVKCKYLTSDKLNLNNVNFKTFMCDDMSVIKNSEKTYSENNDINKDHPCFGYVNIHYLNNPILYITTPPMKCLFGVKKNSNNFQMNLQFTDLEENNKMKDFYDFVQNIEFMCMKYLDLDENNLDKFVSQIQHDKNNRYEPNLLVKIPFHYNQFLTDLYSDNSSVLNIFTIKNFQLMECDLYIDKLWKMNDKFYLKWKCKIIHLL